MNKQDRDEELERHKIEVVEITKEWFEYVDSETIYMQEVSELNIQKLKAKKV